MLRSEFHELYEKTEQHFKAELIQGVVHLASPVKISHSDSDGLIGMLAKLYEIQTPGTHIGVNATVIFDDENECQPDVTLRIHEDYRGNSHANQDNYIQGPPEIVFEVSDSSRSIELNRKRTMYADQGVLEYLVIDLRDQKIHWFLLAEDRELQVDGSMIRLQTFPGFWLDASAFFQNRAAEMLMTFQQGLASPEHAEFVETLKSRQRT